MKITSASLESLQAGFNTKFQDGLKAAPDASIAAWAMDIPSSTAMETYAWLLMLSSMREWLGPRLVNQIATKAATIINRDFEHTIGVKRNDIEDDKLGIYAPLFAMMGADAAALWPKLAVEAVEESGNWIDGAAFFVTTRKYEKQTINNYVNLALDTTPFQTAYTLMAGYKDHAGNLIGKLPTHLMVSPDLRGTGFAICKDSTVVKAVKNVAGAENVGGVAGRNPNEGLCELVVNPRLATGSAYLMHCGAVVKPVAIQKRKEGALIAWDKDSDTCVKDKNENHYGIHYRGAASLTLPNLIIKIKA